MNRLERIFVPFAAVAAACGHTLPQVSSEGLSLEQNEAVPFCEDLLEVAKVPQPPEDPEQRNIELVIDEVRILIQCVYDPEDGKVTQIKVMELHDNTEQTRVQYADIGTITRSVEYPSSVGMTLNVDIYELADGCVDEVVSGQIGPPQTMKSSRASECPPYLDKPALPFQNIDPVMRKNQGRFEKLIGAARNWLRQTHNFPSSGKK